MLGNGRIGGQKEEYLLRVRFLQGLLAADGKPLLHVGVGRDVVHDLLDLRVRSEGSVGALGRGEGLAAVGRKRFQTLVLVQLFGEGVEEEHVSVRDLVAHSKSVVSNDGLHAAHEGDQARPHGHEL